MNQEKIGKFIKKIREENQLTQSQFAQKYHVSFQAVSKWENGKNIPDIALLKQICNDYNASIDELLNDGLKGKKGNKNIIFISIICFLVIVLMIVLILYSKKDDHFEFKKISTTCPTFKVTGSTAYNDDQSSIYISNIEFCGKKENTVYKKITYIFYEIQEDMNITISSGKEKNNITLENYIKNLKINVDNYSKMCKTFSETKLFLEINATDYDDKITTYKIPISLENNCS